MPAHGTRFSLSGRRAGRLITVAFCGFVARHDPRAFRGPHCSASNRSKNVAERSFFVGEFSSFVRSRAGVHSIVTSRHFSFRFTSLRNEQPPHYRSFTDVFHVSKIEQRSTIVRGSRARRREK